MQDRPPGPSGPLLGHGWGAIDAAFDEVYGLPGDEREAAIEALPDDVRVGVRDLISSVGRADERGLLVRPARARGDGGGASERPELAVGTRLGRFVVRRRIGEGGGGAVYAADDPRRSQRVAIKVLRSTEPDALARFDLEQRQLAALRHEAIPRPLDSGTTEDGRPYFAMEYVEGAPITVFARSHSLDTTERVELFGLLCDAVRHAHAHLVVHRDIKPSNVLASKAPDGTCRVHLLDFGVSKPLVGGGYGTTWDGGGGGLTGAGFHPMTPAYAAPEQGRPASAGRAAATTTATDVYALGVLFYELLTRRRPVEGGAPPSRVTDLGVGRRQAWAIDTLVARAIDPDPEARYASADGLHDDVRRVLQGQTPVGARAALPSRGVWFLARHRVGLVVAAVAVAAVVLAFATADQQWRTALGASAAAEGELAGVVGEVLRSAEGTEGRAFLVRAGDVLQAGLQDQPAAEADLSLAVADRLSELGACREAAPLYGRAALLRTTTAPDHPVVVAALRGQARCAAGPAGEETRAGLDRAVDLAEEALALATDRYGERSAVTAELATDLALYHALAGEPTSAIGRVRWVQAVAEELSEDPAGAAERAHAVRSRAGTHVPVFPDAERPDGVALVRARADVAGALARLVQGDPAPAARRAREAVAPLLTSGPDGAGPDGTDAWARAVAFGLGVEAEALRAAGQTARARQLAEQAADVLARRFGRDAPRAVRAKERAVGMGGALDPRLAAGLAADVVRDAERSGDPAALAQALQAEARALAQAGRAEEARAALDRVVSMGEGAVPPRTQALTYAALGEVELAGGDTDAALERTARAVRAARALAPSSGHASDVVLVVAVARAGALVAAGRETEAVGVLEPALRSAGRGAGSALRERATRLLQSAYARI